MKKIVIAVLTIAALPLTAFAADDAGDNTDALIESPSTTSIIGGAASRLVIEAGTDKTTASAKIGKSWTPTGGVDAFKWAVSAKVPFDSNKEDSHDLGTLSGLTAGTSAQIQAGWFHWPHADAKGMDAACRQAIEAMFPGYSWWSPGMPDNSFRYFNVGGKDNALGATDCESILSDREALDSAVKARNDATQQAKPKAGESAPQPALIPTHVSRLQAQYLRNFQGSKVSVSNAYGISIGLTGNRQKFSFADSASAPTTITSTTKEGYGASIAGTLVGSWYVLGAGYEWEKAFKGGKDTQICIPVGTSTATSCGTASLTQPGEKKNQILFVESRMIVHSLAGIAIAPRVEYSLDDSIFGIQMPIFLAANKDHILDGGVTVGWSQDEHWAASVFVGKAFSFF